MKFLIFLRFVMTAVLTYVGGTFLMKQTDYIDLLLDGVALIFIVEIASVLYEQTVRDDVRAQTEDIYPMKVVMYGIESLNRLPGLVDIISIMALVTLCYGILWTHKENIVQPVYDALDCTCRTRGDKCVEAQKFDFDFWHNYWQVVVPGVFANIEKLKTGAAVGVSYLLSRGPEQHTAPAAKMKDQRATHANSKRRMLNSHVDMALHHLDDTRDDKVLAKPLPGSSHHFREQTVHPEKAKEPHQKHHKKHHQSETRD
jgi:hypothetical protein